MRHRSEKSAHWIGLYLSFQLNWVLGPFVDGRLQNAKTSEDTFGHDITPLTVFFCVFKCRVIVMCQTRFAMDQLRKIYKKTS